MDNLWSRLNRWLLVLLCMGLIFFLSPQSDLPRHPHQRTDFLLKKATHLFEYAVLGILLHRAVSDEGSARTSLIRGLEAVSDKSHQSVVSGRNARLSDLAMDIVGVILGFYMASIVILRK